MTLFYVILCFSFALYVFTDITEPIVALWPAASLIYTGLVLLFFLLSLPLSRLACLGSQRFLKAPWDQLHFKRCCISFNLNAVQYCAFELHAIWCTCTQEHTEHIKHMHSIISVTLHTKRKEVMLEEDTSTTVWTHIIIIMRWATNWYVNNRASILINGQMRPT